MRRELTFECAGSRCELATAPAQCLRGEHRETAPPKLSLQITQTQPNLSPEMTLSTAELDAIAATDVRERLAPEVLFPALTSPPFIPTKSLFNLRDVGAVPGSALTETRFYRSGFLEVASKDPEAMAWLASHVRRVFDLRLADERERSPDPVIPGVENVWLDAEEGYNLPPLEEFAVEGGAPAWKKEYMNCALAYRPTIKALLEHIRDRPTEPILFHCTGKQPLPDPGLHSQRRMQALSNCGPRMIWRLTWRFS